MKSKKSAVLLILLLLISSFSMAFSSCGSASENKTSESSETIQVEDDAGRTVELPTTITRIAASGSNAAMMLIPIASDQLVGLATDLTPEQMKYFPDEVKSLPTFGQFYGGKSTLNLEALIEAKPQVIIDLGDKKPSVVDDLNSIQEQTGIPAVFYDGTLNHMADTYRTLGKLLGKEEKAEEIATFIEKTVSMAEEKSAQIAEDDKVTILYGTGENGLAVNADGSVQSQVIDLIGAKNAVIPEEVSNKGGGTTINMESLYENEPDVIILTADGPYDELKTNEWSDLKAVKDNRYYEIPENPYCWMSMPPSVNMILGVWWLGQLVYPDVYNDYDMVEVAQEYYRIFWNYELSDEDAKEMLSNSYFK